MTMRGALVAFALLLSCASAAVELQRHKPHHGGGGQCPKCPHPDTPPPPGEFNFYFLVRQWPYTFCSFKECSTAPDLDNGFTLHGLWPNLDNHCPEDFPQVCYHSKFDSRKIPAGVLNDMETMWPSYKSDNDCFHNHEWECHGTCSNHTQAGYFADVIELHKANDIAGALAKHNIEPSTQAVHKEDFIEALTKEFHYAPILHCSSDASGSYIDEVWQCVDKDSLQVMDCDQACGVPTSCAVRPDQQCDSYIMYDTPRISLGPPPSSCDLHCKIKSGTCSNKKGNDVPDML